MEELTLAKWIWENEKKWGIICGIGNKTPTKKDIEDLFYEMLDLIGKNSEFATLFTIVSTKYYYILQNKQTL